MDTICRELSEQKNVRENLSRLRRRLREENCYGELFSLVERQEDLFLGFLEHEDAKTRKNAALLLGDLEYERSADALLTAYRNETTLFVRSAYLDALGRIDVEPMLPELKKCLAELLESEVAEENRKHVQEEIRALRRLLIQYEDIDRHTFRADQRDYTVLLVTNRMYRETVCNMVDKGRIHPLGVLVRTSDLSALFRVRAYREMLFPMGEKTLVSADPGEAAKALAPWMLEQCLRCHREAGNFYFRVDYKGRGAQDARSLLAKRLGSSIEQISGGRLVNSPSDYEVELRLTENREGRYFPCLKFSTLKDLRFAYRKNAISASIHPSTAALIALLAKPYLKENAQIIDPFCGVGTMLIERSFAVRAKEMYATDIFGDAVRLGRENAAAAGVSVNFIHRDFFDFKHEYKFDEIITNMPLRGKKTKEEQDRFYADFFRKALQILKPEAVIVMYTNEIGFVKKQLRIYRELVLLQENCMQDKTGFYLLVMGVKRG